MNAPSIPGIVTDPAQLIPGKWYCIGMQNDEGVIQWGQILRFDGREHHSSCPDWSDENGDTVESLWDCGLRISVSMDAADAYACQS